MVREAIRKGIRLDYLSVDSWFTCHYAYTDAEYSNRKIRIFFCKRGRKGTWNAFLSTNTGLNFFEAYRIYYMR